RSLADDPTPSPATEVSANSTHPRPTILRPCRGGSGSLGSLVPTGTACHTRKSATMVARINHLCGPGTESIMVAWVSTHHSPPAEWAAHHFGGCWLGHKARNQRLVGYARALAEKPGKALPELFTRKYDIEATYELLRRDDLTPDRIQAPHRRLVKAE